MRGRPRRRAPAPAGAAPAPELKRQTATVDCPKSMVGRVIGKNGETIKALQTYTGALIQIDQTVEPTKVTISGTPHSLSLAVSMVTDIVKGTFKGFALLRQITNAGVRPMGMAAPMAQPRPVYAPGYGLIPPSQVGSGAGRRTARSPGDVRKVQPLAVAGAQTAQG
jgi:rRNA processing protein Krr1/Pno1